MPQLSFWLSWIPNGLSIFRLLLGPFCAWIFYIKKTPSMDFLALLFLFFITDFFDGYLARKFGWTSALGKILDPLGDKVMALSFFTSFFFLRYLSIWIYGIIFLKELLLVLGGAILFLTNKPIPNVDIMGKINTFVQGIFLGSLVLKYICEIFYHHEGTLMTFYMMKFFFLTTWFLSVILVGTTVLSFLVYSEKTFGLLWNISSFFS